MSGDDGVAERRQFAFDDVQVGAADPAGAHPEQHLARSGDGLRNIAHAQHAMRQHGGAHVNARDSGRACRSRSR